MFTKNPWPGIGFDAWLLSLDAMTVIGLRTMRIAQGGALGDREAQRMVARRVYQPPPRASPALYPPGTCATTCTLIPAACGGRHASDHDLPKAKVVAPCDVGDSGLLPHYTEVGGTLFIV